MRKTPKYLAQAVPDWLAHVALGLPLREIARRRGLAPSTVLRRVQACETLTDTTFYGPHLEQLAQAITADPARLPDLEALGAILLGPPRGGLRAPNSPNGRSNR